MGGPVLFAGEDGADLAGFVAKFDLLLNTAELGERPSWSSGIVEGTIGGQRAL